MRLDLPEPEDDGLCIPDVKFHSRDKHHFLRRYMHAFTTAMRDKWELHYIDLFTGAGIERVEDLGLDWGSPLLAALMPYKFYQLHLCEQDTEKFTALKRRLSKEYLLQPCEPLLYCGDANTYCCKIIGQIPERKTLSLAFLDPYGLHLDYETVREIAKRPADLIIFFPDHIDALRNWQEYYLDNENSNLDRFLGRGDWRETMGDRPQTEHAEVLRGLYEEQLKKLGFQHFAYERIRRKDGRFLYRLIFATRHKKGLTIWKNTSNRNADGQYGMQW